jgi:DNA (cytosine-5)-methyltransferase 1
MLMDSHKVKRPALRVLSVCSGIGAPETAWRPLGWKLVACAEIEAFPSAVLAHHYPDVPNLGDMTKINGADFKGEIDVLVGGTPCQSFSVAGLRLGPGADLTKPRWWWREKTYCEKCPEAVRDKNG